MSEAIRRPDWLAEMFPWEQHSVMVNGRRMAYIDEGDRSATPVLLLHGNPTWAFRALEQALGFRAGRSYWRGASENLYAIDLGDFGRGRPSMAIIHGFWPRYEPRPLTDAEIDEDLADFCLWMADACDGLEVADVRQTLGFSMPSRSPHPKR